MSIYTSNPVDTAISTNTSVPVTFSLLRDTFGYPDLAIREIKFSEFLTTSSLGNLGQANNIASFRGKILPDLQATVVDSTPIYNKTYETRDTTFSIGTAFNFTRRQYRNLVPSSASITPTLNIQYGTVVEYIVNSTSFPVISNIVQGGSTVFKNLASASVNVKIRKRNNFVKTIITRTVDISDILTNQSATFTATLTKTENRHSPHAHAYHHYNGHHGPDVGHHHHHHGQHGDAHAHRGGPDHGGIRGHHHHHNHGNCHNCHNHHHDINHCTPAYHGQHCNHHNHQGHHCGQHGHHHNHGNDTSRSPNNGHVDSTGRHAHNNGNGHHHLHQPHAPAHGAGHRHAHTGHTTNGDVNGHKNQGLHHHRHYHHWQVSSVNAINNTNNSSDVADPKTFFSITSLVNNGSTCSSESSKDKYSGCTTKYNVRITLPWNNTSYTSGNTSDISLTAAQGYEVNGY